MPTDAAGHPLTPEGFPLWSAPENRQVLLESVAALRAVAQGLPETALRIALAIATLESWFGRIGHWTERWDGQSGSPNFTNTHQLEVSHNWGAMIASPGLADNDPRVYLHPDRGPGGLVLTKKAKFASPEEGAAAFLRTWSKNPATVAGAARGDVEAMARAMYAARYYGTHTASEDPERTARAYADAVRGTLRFVVDPALGGATSVTPRPPSPPTVSPTASPSSSRSSVLLPALALAVGGGIAYYALRRPRPRAASSRRSI